MKIFVFLIILILAVSVTAKVTFDMTQEIVGSLFIQGFIIDHGVHSKLVEAIEQNDIDKALEIAKGMKNYNYEIVETMTTDLSNGRYSFMTEKQLENGKQFLENTTK